MPSLKTYFFNICRSLFKIKFMETLLLNFTMGKDPFSTISKFVPNHYQYKPDTKRKVKRNGIKYELDISNFFDWYVYFGFADDWIENMLSFISPGDVVIDVGVNNGKSLLRIAKTVGKTGKVYGFEPSEENFYKANRNVSTNGFKNIALYKMALGHNHEKVFLNKPQPNNHGLNFFSKANNPEKNLVEYTTVELDDIVGKFDHPDISLIHIDVEGYDTAVLKGAFKTIKKYMPVLFLKINNSKLARAGTSSTELVELLHANNYQILEADSEMEISLAEINNAEETAVYCLPKA